MYLLRFISRGNKILAPIILRHGLTISHILKRLANDHTKPYQNPIIDNLCLLPFAQRVISIEIHDDVQFERRRREKKKKTPGAFDKFVNRAWNRLFPNDKQQDDDDDIEEMSPDYRLKLLETYIRPALLPRERWDDCHRWQFNNHFVAWLRREFLLAKYGERSRDIISSYPEFALSKQSRKQRRRRRWSSLLFSMSSSSPNNRFEQEGDDGRRLPTASRLTTAFGMTHWNRNTNHAAGTRRMSDISSSLGGGRRELKKLSSSSIPLPQLPPATKLHSLPFDDVLELTGCHVSSTGPFNLYCEERGTYEFLTREYVNALADYIMSRTRGWSSGGEGEGTLILEVGAGDGTLAHYLRVALEQSAMRWEERMGGLRRRGRRGGGGGGGVMKRKRDVVVPEVVATDDGSWKILPEADVERLDVEEAMEKYVKEGRQLIVICSWMPMGEDWTAIMREKGADEYILIGETDVSNCGHNWYTWGNPDYRFDEDDDDDEEEEEDEEGEGESEEKKGDEESNVTRRIPPSEADGFERIDLKDLSVLQYSRFDSQDSRNSSTVSFRRRRRKD